MHIIVYINILLQNGIFFNQIAIKISFKVFSTNNSASFHDLTKSRA
jgi:hypothetical protein